MLVSEVKKIGKVGKNLLENKNADEMIEILIEKPLQRACKECKEKNIETVMSSANRNNIVKNDQERVNKIDIIEKTKQHKMQTFKEAGKGYTWLMLNYNTLSDENRKIIFSLEEELGEDAIWFVKSNYVDAMNAIRKRLKLKLMVEEFDDKYAEKFSQKQLLLMYNNNYPRRCIFIRMPIDEKTKVEDVENYYSKIISMLVKQEKVEN